MILLNLNNTTFLSIVENIHSMSYCKGNVDNDFTSVNNLYLYHAAKTINYVFIPS